MKTKSRNFMDNAAISWEYAGEGMTRQVLGYDGQIMMVKVKFEKGAIGYEHEHYHSQVSYVASGKFEVIINGEKKILGPGDAFYAEPDTRHGTVCLEEGMLIDVFSPMRQDFLKK